MWRGGFGDRCAIMSESNPPTPGCEFHLHAGRDGIIRAYSAPCREKEEQPHGD
jgi:hypothetical protein